MATIGTLKTIVDWTKQMDPDGSVSAVAELLSQTNQIMDRMLFKEGNLPTGHQISQRTGLPAVYWKLINKGTPSSKATTAQVTEQCAILSARSEVDVDSVVGDNVEEQRLIESRAFIEAMGQEFSSTLFYGSAASPEEFVGLANRYTNLTGDGNSENILNGGGTGGSDYTSVWLVGMGEMGIYGIFPKGSTAGLQHTDKGIQDAFDSNNDRFDAYIDAYKMKAGLCVKDWRYGVRIPNLDISDMAGTTGTQATTASTFLPKLMSRAIDRLPSLEGVSPYFLMNRTSASLLRVLALEKSSSAVTIEEGLNQFGMRIFQLKFLGIPVLINDAITNTETEVS